MSFDPAVISFRDLLDVFFSIHDPTTLNRQGADVGPQYRSVILTHSERQREDALEAIRSIGEQGVWPDPIVTEVAPLEVFYPAEVGAPGLLPSESWSGILPGRDRPQGRVLPEAAPRPAPVVVLDIAPVRALLCGGLLLVALPLAQAQAQAAPGGDLTGLATPRIAGPRPIPSRAAARGHRFRRPGGGPP